MSRGRRRADSASWSRHSVARTLVVPPETRARGQGFRRRGFLDPETGTTGRGGLRRQPPEAGDPAPERGREAPELLRAPRAQPLDDLRQVGVGFPGPRRRRTERRAARYPPAAEECAERRGAGMIAELAERGGGEQVRRPEMEVPGFVVRGVRRAADGPTPAAAIIQEPEGRASRPRSPAKPFASHDRRPGLLLDLQVVSEDRRPLPLAILQLEHDRTRRAARPDSLGSSPVCPGLRESGTETLPEERHRVPDRGLAAAVRPHQRRQRREASEFDPTQDPKVPDPQRFEAHMVRGSFGLIGSEIFAADPAAPPRPLRHDSGTVADSRADRPVSVRGRLDEHLLEPVPL